jgi:hypothetical protein
VIGASRRYRRLTRSISWLTIAPLVNANPTIAPLRRPHGLRGGIGALWPLLRSRGSSQGLPGRNGQSRSATAVSSARSRGLCDEETAALVHGNYARLAQIKSTYGPNNFFRVNQNIQPA